MSLKDRLLSKREIKDTGYITPCWLFIGIHNSVYGAIRLDGGKIAGQVGAHVAAAILWLKNYDSKLNVLHKCDIRRCFNPEHLFQGTQSDNIKDCSLKKRHPESRKTHCKYGHEFSIKNTIKYKNKRICKICRDRNNIVKY